MKNRNAHAMFLIRFGPIHEYGYVARQTHVGPRKKKNSTITHHSFELLSTALFLRTSASYHRAHPYSLPPRHRCNNAQALNAPKTLRTRNAKKKSQITPHPSQHTHTHTAEKCRVPFYPRPRCMSLNVPVTDIA